MARWQPGDVGADDGNDKQHSREEYIEEEGNKHHQMYTSEEGSLPTEPHQVPLSIIRPSPHGIGLRTRLRSV